MSSDLADAVLEAIASVTEPLFERIQILEVELERLKTIPPIPGPAGPQGDRGEAGAHGLDGINGKDGIGLTGALITKDGHLVLTLADGSMRDVGRVVGLDGVKGESGQDGRDGLGFDDLSVSYDGQRQFAFIFQRGELVKSFPFTVPMILDRGVWAASKTYEAGDSVTWGGSTYIAQAPTTAKPGESGELSRAWRLSVKRGNEGKQGPMGPKGDRGDRGDKGDIGYLR